ncbi:MAG: nucleoside 2-deoxyribosyltransferase [Candidatus Delongbacteria bacterium]|nr:nucleoside 2-deoxyribosyltransferase [Candidatus Delongbacteria bacterium]
MTRLSDYTRLMQALTRQGEPDYVPLVELGISAAIKEKLLNRKCLALHDEIEFAEMAGYDYIKLQPIIDMNPAKIPSQSGHYETQLVEFEGTRKWANQYQNMITSVADFEHYRFPTLESIDYSRFELVKSILPDHLMVIGQYGDIFTMVWEMMGFENFSIALFENPDLVAELFDTIGRLVYSMFHTMVQMDMVRAIWYSDDIAYAGGLMVGPDVLRTYFFPWLKKIGDLARDYQKPFLYHSDGKLWMVMEDIIQAGVTALHPIEPKAMDIVEIKNQFGHSLCIIGNIDLAYTLTRGTPQEVEREVRQRIETLAPGGGYCLGSANSIPEYVPYPNYLAMIQATRQFGRYPIANS